MTETTLARLKEWFTDYCSTYHSTDVDQQRNILLKEVHTRNVCADIVRIAVGEGMAGDVATAEAIALFHDIGRFEQYRCYRTFRDSDSVNHAALGVRILDEKGVLEDLPPGERRTIREAVRLHNVYAVPPRLDPEVIPFLHIIRDADKIDIWRIFIELFEAPPEQRASAASLGFPDTGTITGELLDAFREERMISLSRVKTLDDFKLLQLSWIYDINSRSAMAMIGERDIIPRLSASLPALSDRNAVVGALCRYVDCFLSTGEKQWPQATFKTQHLGIALKEKETL